MKKGSLKKYLLPNLPYLFMAWTCLKLGTAYRLAAGANAGEKLVGMMNTINSWVICSTWRRWRKSAVSRKGPLHQSVGVL